MTCVDLCRSGFLYMNAGSRMEILRFATAGKGVVTESGETSFPFVFRLSSRRGRMHVISCLMQGLVCGLQGSFDSFKVKPSGPRSEWMNLLNICNFSPYAIVVDMRAASIHAKHAGTMLSSDMEDIWKCLILPDTRYRSSCVRILRFLGREIEHEH